MALRIVVFSIELNDGQLNILQENLAFSLAFRCVLQVHLHDGRVFSVSASEKIVKNAQQTESAVPVSSSSAGLASIGIHGVACNPAVRLLHEFFQLVLKSFVVARCGERLPCGL